MTKPKSTDNQSADAKPSFRPSYDAIRSAEKITSRDAQLSAKRTLEIFKSYKAK